MKKLLYLAIGVITLLSAHACQEKIAKNYNKIWVDDAGLAFIRNGAEGYLTVIKASGLAKKHSKNKRVLNFAKMMLDDHHKSLTGLKQLEAIKLVEEQDTISMLHQQQISELSRQSGNAFDKQYLQLMIAGHSEAIPTFTVAGQNADPDISKFSGKALPMIRRHLDAANAILSSLK